MSDNQTERLADEWQGLIEQFPPALIQEVQALAKAHAADLADLFYQALLEDPHAACFLTHDQVKNHLHHSMQAWIASLFSVTNRAELEEIIGQQKKIGHVHARIEIPVSLVMRGARLLKGRLGDLANRWGHTSEARQAIACLCTAYIDLALEIMCLAFSQSHDRNSRAEEAYRLFSVSQNIGAEKEQQRAALLGWENQLMFDLATGNANALVPLASSEFGLWFRHKALHAFQGAPESQTILNYIQQIDQSLFTLTSPSSPEQHQQLLRQLHEHIKSIRFLLDSLLEQARDLEAGRDVLTRLLNRKFLPVVMGKELLYSRQSGHGFAVLMIDIDYFKPINDNYGHDAGDQVLQQIAGLLSVNIRSGDYAFRLGGEEFLLILVDVSNTQALNVAEKLRKLIGMERFQLHKAQEIQLTVSIGVAAYDGHPDYQKLLQRADQALYQAKNTGRNCCILSD